MSDQHRLKVFLSADIVGSTAYKQPFRLSDTGRASGSDVSGVLTTEQLELARTEEWRDAIQSFYFDMNRLFIKNWNAIAIKVSKRNAEQLADIMLGAGKPRIWKTIGDEVVFWKEITHENQIYPLLVSWLNSINDMRSIFQKKLLPLDVKSTVWAGEFPIRNKSLYLRNLIDGSKLAEETLQIGSLDEHLQAHHQKLGKNEIEEGLERFYGGSDVENVDFIGPAIDVGFRLAKYSTAKKMMLSVDTVALICKATDNFRNCGLGGDGLWQGTTNRQDIANCYAQDIVLSNDLMAGMFVARRDNNSVGPLSKFIVNYSGSEFLQGVLGGVKYPLFWINASSKKSIHQAKDALYIKGAKREGVAWDSLNAFLEAFYRDRSNFIDKPKLTHDCSNL